MYLPRRAEPRLHELLLNFPVVVLTGPRQSGKSTLVRQVLKGTPYVTFDDPEEQGAFEQDPRGFLRRFEGPVILDEVQRVPKLFRYLKMEVDSAPATVGRYLLTGSNQLLLQRNLSESLAGRAGFLSLLPLETAELPPALRPLQLLRGSYPGLAVRNYAGSRDWFSAYLATYLERDLRVMLDIGKLADFQTLVRLLAARTSQEFNASALAREIGVSSHTIEAWTSALHASYLTFALAPFAANLGKRLIKRQKVYWWDTGLVCSLTGLSTQEALDGGPLAGPLFENLIVAECVKRSLHRGSGEIFWFYRDNSGLEVDLIVEDQAAKTVSLNEIKSGATAKADWATRLKRVAALLSPTWEAQGYVVKCRIIYRGETLKSWPTPDTDFVNWQDL